MWAGLFVLFIPSCFDCDCSTFSTVTIAHACFEEVVVPPRLTGFSSDSSGWKVFFCFVFFKTNDSVKSASHQEMEQILQ